MPKTNPRHTDETEKLHHYIQLEIEPPAALPLHAIDSAQPTGGVSKPSITTVDKKGNVYVPNDDGHLVPTTDKVGDLSIGEPEAECELPLLSGPQMDLDLGWAIPHILKGMGNVFPLSPPPRGMEGNGGMGLF